MRGMVAFNTSFFREAGYGWFKLVDLLASFLYKLLKAALWLLLTIRLLGSYQKAPKYFGGSHRFEALEESGVIPEFFPDFTESIRTSRTIEYPVHLHLLPFLPF
jgi:hypothetical protein